MRELGTISSERHARLFADHLLTKDVTSKLVASKNDEWIVWVHDENRLSDAADELRRFLDNPNDARYKQAPTAATAVLREKGAAEKRFRKNSRDLRDRWEGSAWSLYPLTLVLILVCVGVAIFTNFGSTAGSGLTLIRPLAFSDWSIGPNGRPIPHGLDDIRRGQIWRTITPIFIHYGVAHLIFNMLFLRSLGGLIEARKGTFRFGLLVVVSALASNFAEYFAESQSSGLSVFGGMSGVGYALFGYLWTKGHLHPDEGLGVSQNTAVVMIAWFFLCMTGSLGPVANTAHGAGLVFGMIVGLTRF